MRGLLIFATVLLVCLLLPQRTLHGVDGNVFVHWVEFGSTQGYPRHVAYLHIGGLIYTLLEPFGAGGHLALRVASALGTALGVLFLYRAFRLLLPAHLPSAIAPALAVFVTPSWFYYATQAEIPGVFAAGTGAAWWAFARWTDRPTALRAALVGLACAAAGAIHSFGHLLTPSFAAAAFVLRRPALGSGLRQLAAAGTAHLAAGAALSLWLAAGTSGQAADAIGHLEERWQTFAPLTAPAVCWREWVIAHAPWSIGLFLALTSARSRRWAMAGLALLALHLPLCVLLLGFHELHERGAYLLPLTPIAVLATAHFVTLRGFRLAIAGSIVLTAFAVAPGWRHPLPPDFGAGIAQLEQEQKIALLVSTQAELDTARLSVRQLIVIDLRQVIGAYVQLPQPAPPFADWFDAWHSNLTDTGMTAVLTESVLQFFAATDDPQLQPFWHDHVPARYEVRPVERRGFRGAMLLAR